MTPHVTRTTWIPGLLPRLVLVAMTTLAGCIDGGTGAPAGPDGGGGNGGGSNAPASATIGPEGGTLGVANATLTIPAGALAQPTPVSITEAAGAQGLLGSVYNIQPDGTALLTPATLTLRYSAADLPTGYAPGEVAIVSLDEHYPPPAAGHPTTPLMAAIPYHLPTDVDSVNTAGSAPIRHFSRYGVRPITRVPAQPTEGMYLVLDLLGRGDLDVGVTDVGVTTNDGAGTAVATYDLHAREITMTVATAESSTAGDLYAHGLLAKLFLLTRGDPGVETVQARIQTGVVDVGGMYTGNCVWGERRLRLMDVGTGETVGQQVPVQLDVQGVEWQVYPPALGLPGTPHQDTATYNEFGILNGDDIWLSGTLRVGHYYAVVLDLTAIAGTNVGGQPQACTSSAQLWAPGEFQLTRSLIRIP